jgi:hypothetical protein
VSTLAIWLFVLVIVMFIMAVFLLVRAGWSLFRRTKGLVKEVGALQEDLSDVVGSAQTRHDDPAH